MRSDIVPWTVLPDYELPDHTTKHRKLSELQGQDPMVLAAEVIARGTPDGRRPCPTSSRTRVGYCRLVTISTDHISEMNERSGVVALPRRRAAYCPEGSRHRRIHGS